jgi:hypothetical protein
VSDPMTRRLFFLLAEESDAVCLVTDLEGIGVAKTHLDEFHGALAHGEIVLMVDVPRQRVAQVEELVRQQYPEAMPGGAGWTIDASNL